MNTYETYKPISLPWLHYVPSHWDMVRNKVVMKESKNTVGDESSKYTLLSLTKSGVIVRDLTQMKGKFPSDFSTYKIVEDEQIIFCLFDIDETPRTVGLSHHSGMITGAYDVFYITGINPKYLQYYYLSLDNVKAMRPLYTGLRKVIGMTTFMQISLPLPPRTEQDQIVCFLDWKLSQINRLINAKKKQIALLQDQKRVVVNEAVMNAAWSTRRLKTFLKESNDAVGDKADEYDLLSLTKGGVIIRDLSTGKGKFPSDFGTYKVVRAGQIIFCLFDIDETPRTVGLSYNDGMITGAYDVFSISDIEPKFLEYYFIAIDNVKGLKPLYSGLRKVVNKEKFLQIQVPIPPIKEQQSIVVELDAKCACINRLIEKINTEIKFLNEYRIRLISDVATGKIDVRNETVPDYEAIEETAENESLVVNEEELYE